MDYKLLGRVIAQAKPYRGVLIWAAFLGVILAPISILRPYLVQVMVDKHIFNHDIPGLTRMAGLFIAVLLFESVLRYIFMYASGWLGGVVVRDLRVKVFNHIVSLRMSYFDRTPIGINTTRTISDIENINQVFSQGIITIIADMLVVVSVLAVMFAVSWKLTLVTLTTMPFLIAATYIFQGKNQTQLPAGAGGNC
ncbi:MAG: ABC transporter transmembrane domain-containing protein, partial [Bacteroidota bacterium]